MHKGSCLCGAVSFTYAGDMPEASACHCTKCRKSTGHHEAGVDVDRGAVTVHGGDNVSWYVSSDWARRGFCRTCGSPMFFEPLEGDWIGLMLGSFDGPTGTKIARHIFVGDKGDYYALEDGAEQFETVPGR